MKSTTIFNEKRRTRRNAATQTIERVFLIVGLIVASKALFAEEPIGSATVPTCRVENETPQKNDEDAERESGDVGGDATRFEFSAEKMGVPTRILFFAPDSKTAEAAADAVWKRFDELNAALSDYDPESEIIRVCRKSSETNDFVSISADLRRALTESRKFCRLTDGAFDATVGPIVKLWRRSRYFKELPPPSVLEPAKKAVGLDVWELDERGVKTTSANVRFDVGGIAKGIALDEALDVLRTFGVESALIDSGGDLRIGSAPPGKNGWTIGIASLAEDGSPAFYRTLSDVGVASSGDANRFIEIDGVRYSHIVDPRTGNPLTRRCVATVLAPNATTADALASAVCVLGGEESLRLFDRLRKNPDASDGLSDDPSEKFSPLELLLYQVKENSDPPFTPEKIDVFATPEFQNSEK